jgi:hypothetical protein
MADKAVVKEYGLFLSHHKLVTGLVCRQMKMTLDARSKEGIFFDVDSLENTSTLVETVKSKVKTLVVVEAGDVYSRKWCAVEIATAWKHGVPIIVVAPTFYKDGQKNFLQEIDGDLGELKGIGTFAYNFEEQTKSRWTQQDLQELEEMGIKISEIKKAYQYVKGLPRIEYPLDGDDKAIWESAERIITKGACSLVKLKWAPDQFAGQVVIICDRNSLQQTTAARVLHFMFLQAGVQSVFANGHAEIEAMKAERLAVIVLFSKNLAMNPSAVGAITAATRKGTKPVCIRALQHFPPLDSAWLKEVRSGKGFHAAHWEEVRHHAPGASGTEVTDALTKLYQIIAWRFSPDDPAPQMRSEFQRILEKAEVAMFKRQSSKQSNGDESVCS